MKSLGKWVAMSGMAALLLASCFEPPQYSPIPAIEFESITFTDVANTSDADSLVLTIRFKDGDGDLGLDASNPLDTFPPYNERYFFKLPDSTIVTYKTKRTNPDFAFLPDFVSPYNCINWAVIPVNDEVDTFYFEKNPDHYNIFVDFFVQNQDGSGTYTEFDWTTEFAYPQCGITFDGRFPIMSKDLSQKAALDGKIKYSMASTGFLILFSIKTLKLQITIQDRALNKSNTITTEPFTLQQIKKSG